ncbi:MAG: peptide/nickel transport system permease protein [Thermomicrobiales bacterium]|nr:peptide/nickel transport system permease protein [Thermomicrobiales bacterium]
MAHRTETFSTEVDAKSTDGSAARQSALLRNELRSTPGFYSRAWYKFRQNHVAVAGLVVTVAIVIFVLSAGLISEHVTGYDYAKGDLRNKLRGPFAEDHILGTDAKGRDLLTRAANGGRISLRVAGLAAVAILVIGSTVGSIAGYFGGWIDNVLMRLVDILLSLPGLAVLLLVSTIYTPGPDGLALVIALISWTGIARLVRGEVLSLRNRDFIDAARIIGVSDARIIARHIFPNVVPIIVVWISLAIPSLILTEAALSFLGFGVQIPTPSWGNMLEVASGFFTQSWWNVFLPGFLIYITVLAINLVGIGLRDALDPRLSQ